MAENENPHAPAKVEVATTMRPNDPIKVTERERDILRHQGLLVEPDGATPAAVSDPPAKGRAKPEGDAKP